MAYFWRCPDCDKLQTLDDDEAPMAAWEATYLHEDGCAYDRNAPVEDLAWDRYAEWVAKGRPEGEF